MTRQHTVRQGESLISLAQRYGTTAEKIRDHPDNQGLHQVKRHRSILNPGDVVVIPDRELKEVDGDTGQRHRFRSQGRHTWLRLRLYLEGEPRINAPYQLLVEGQKYTGQLDDDGRLEVQVPANAQEAILRLGDHGEEEMRLYIGHMDPIEEISGIQKRLNNLGFYCGVEDGQVSSGTSSAIIRFQLTHGLEPTGEIDDETKCRLEEIYGC